jgi:hypothetical protein
MIKSADIVFLGCEPPAFASAAFEQLRKAGLAINVIAMPLPANDVLGILSSSSSDAIVYISPFQFSGFIADHAHTVRALGKPVISVVSEHTFGNGFLGYAEFERAGEYADFYACLQDCDTAVMREMGRRTATIPSWVATDVFREGPAITERIQKLVFVGHTDDYTPGMYAERRRMLAALTSSGLVDVLNIPRHDSTVALVANAYRSYAGVFCPPANGRGHSTRVFEAAASGALVVECQEIDAGNLWFHDGIHRVAIPCGLPEEDLCRTISELEFSKLQDIATQGRLLAIERHNPKEVWRSLFKMADKALTG